MGFSVKKRDMYKLALFLQKFTQKKRDKAKKKWDSSVFDIKNRDVGEYVCVD